METNEKLETALLQETEKAMVEMITELEMVKEGDLQTLEQKVLTACLALGRSMMESILNHAGEEEERKARRDGECGHRQRLVDMRPKQLHTLMGKVTIRRAYYQCLTKKEEESAVMGKRHTMRCGDHSPDGPVQECKDCWGNWSRG